MCDSVDGRWVEAVNEYASTCDGCGDLTMHEDLTSDESGLGFCPWCSDQSAQPLLNPNKRGQYKVHHPTSKYNYIGADLDLISSGKRQSIAYYDDLLSMAQELNYPDFVTALVAQYRRHKSGRIAGGKFGLHANTARAILRAAGEPLRGPGGANNPWGNKGRPVEVVG